MKVTFSPGPKPPMYFFGLQVSPVSVGTGDSGDGVDLIGGGGAALRPPLSEIGVAVGSSLIASSVASTEAFMESSPTVSTPGSLRFAGLGVQPARMTVTASKTIGRGLIILIKELVISIRVKLLISMIASFEVRENPRVIGTLI